MAKHEVTFQIPERPVSHKDIRFNVHMNDGKFGELRISKGSIVWFPANKPKGFRLSWTQLDRLAQATGREGYYPV